jgi:L-asparagine transporter-like permease
MNSSGALMMFTYAFVAVAHFRFPYSNPAHRTAGGAQLIAGGAALAMFAVMIAMCFMPSKQPEMVASTACLGIIVFALLVKRALTRDSAGVEGAADKLMRRALRKD